MRRTRQISSDEPTSSKKPNTDHLWNEVGGLMYANFNSQPSGMILGFDMDSTLISTVSGKTFAINENDWQLLFNNVPSVIKGYADRGFRVVIFTNQKGVAAGKQDKGALQRKIQMIVEAIDVPILVMAATADDKFRKPCPTMWTYLAKNLNEGVPIDETSSIYVGDAAGRPAGKGRKKDFNDTDLKFAINIGVTFKTPEMFFQNAKDDIPEIRFKPKGIREEGPALEGDRDNTNIAKEGQECIIFVGSPGSGKSTFWKNHLQGYTRVNNDTLKSKDRCLRVMEESLVNGKSCVIDNTNPTREARGHYIRMAKRHNVPVRCFVFRMDKDLAFHLDTLRLVNPFRNHHSSRVGSMPIHKFYKDFQEPAIDEGLESVHQVNLVAGPFESEDDRTLFYSYVHS